MIADLNAEGAQAHGRPRSTPSGGRARAMRCDVSSEADFRAVVDATQRELGGLHIMVNNAGATHRNKPALEVTEEEFDRVYRVNLKSLFWSTRTVMPGFIEQGMAAASSTSLPPPASARARAWSGTAAARPP
jgi:NAD(P)-dependent dehydrogenase (short-subunit alcohol dehydrogenase family)